MSSYLVTGAAGFIGSNLTASLSERGEEVRGIDDFSTGRRENLDRFDDSVDFREGSILDEDFLREAMKGVDFVLHHAAIPSVPRSIDAPILSCRANVEGSMKVFLAARDAGVRRTIAASSSSVCGNMTEGPNDESLNLYPISPYAVSKVAVENYARVFSGLYGVDIVCLRYFNVFGPGQDPNSAYSAAIPKFITRLLGGEMPTVHGDGSQSRDFTFVENVIDANVLACSAAGSIAGTYNIACGKTTSVLAVANILMEIIGIRGEPEWAPGRPGDIHFSQACIDKAAGVFGYEPRVSIREGLERTVRWYQERSG